MRTRRDVMDGSGLRDLEEIREEEPAAGSSKMSALVLASLGGACIVFAAVALVRTPPKQKAAEVDPLGDLVARSQPAGVKKDKRGDLVGHEITFPTALSDTKNTTALEAVRGPRAASSEAPPAVEAPALPPDLAEKLLPQPVPAGHIMQAADEQAKEPPRDTLTAMAKQVAREGASETAVAGTPGGYQLQVSSFKKQSEAEGFAAALRRRGHRAYVEAAQVPGRGLWYRVRIGPFKHKHSAVLYRQDFEAKERIVTFIIDPPKTTVTVKDEG